MAVKVLFTWLTCIFTYSSRHVMLVPVKLRKHESGHRTSCRNITFQNKMPLLIYVCLYMYVFRLISFLFSYFHFWSFKVWKPKTASTIKSLSTISLTLNRSKWYLTFDIGPVKVNATKTQSLTHHPSQIGRGNSRGLCLTVGNLRTTTTTHWNENVSFGGK